MEPGFNTLPRLAKTRCDLVDRHLSQVTQQYDFAVLRRQRFHCGCNVQRKLDLWARTEGALKIEFRQ